MIIKYQYFQTESLLIIKLEGEFSLDGYQKSITILNKDPNWKDVKKVLLDIRQTLSSNYNVIAKELFVIRKSADFPSYKMAYIVEDPILLANLDLYVQMSNTNGIYDYFSTIIGAIRHLNIQYSCQEIEKLITHLNQKIEHL
jgi:hypothetical protein